jgi:hypothetical protein
MLSASMNAILGVVLVIAVGDLKLGLSLSDELLLVLASNVAGLFSLGVYTAASRNPWARRHIVHGPLRTWVMFLIAYFGSLLAMAAPLRDATGFAWLVIPEMLVTGFAIMIFGPLHDKLVARGKRH